MCILDCAYHRLVPYAISKQNMYSWSKICEVIINSCIKQVPVLSKQICFSKKSKSCFLKTGNKLGADKGKIVTLGTEILPQMGPNEKWESP